MTLSSFVSFYPRLSKAQPWAVVHRGYLGTRDWFNLADTVMLVQVEVSSRAYHLRSMDEKSLSWLTNPLLSQRASSKQLPVIHVGFGRSFKECIWNFSQKAASKANWSHQSAWSALPFNETWCPRESGSYWRPLLVPRPSKQWVPTAFLPAAWTPIHEFTQKSEIHCLFLWKKLQRRTVGQDGRGTKPPSCWMSLSWINAPSRKWILPSELQVVPI